MEELHKRKLLKNKKFCKLNFCKYCVLEKQIKVSFKVTEKEIHTEEILDYIHSDVLRPTLTNSHGGARYYVTLMNGYLQKIWVYLMGEKSEVFVEV